LFIGHPSNLLEIEQETTMAHTDYPAKYHNIIDDETWAFIEKTNSWYPTDTVDLTIKEQREIYNRMCRAFFTGYPDGVTSEDSHINTPTRHIPIRTYRRSDGQNQAHVIYFHGGGFVVGGLESHDDICAEICSRTGLTLTSVDYRLGPEHTYPADFEDALAAFKWATDKVGKPIILAGDSAGGCLAAAVSHATRSVEPAPAGQVLIYPGLGSDLSRGSFVDHAQAPMLTTQDTTFYKKTRTGGDADLLRHKHCTPLNDTDFTGLPPTVIVSAQCDPLSDNGRDYRDMILQAGGKAVWFNETGLVHGYLRARHTVARARDSFARIVDAIDALAMGKWPY